LVDWLIRCLVDSLFGGLVDWLIRCLVDSLFGGLVGWLVGCWLVVGWLLVGWLVGWLCMPALDNILVTKRGA